MRRPRTPAAPALLLVSTMLVASLLSPPPAQAAQEVHPLVQACYDVGAPRELCRGLDHLLQLPGVICRELLGGTSCALVDGRTVDEAAVAAHEQSWLVRALALQRGLDDDQAFRNELWTHTHNSFNADAYPQTFYGLDPNQLYTITDQLRMGIRAIEIDVHWAPHPSGTPENDFNNVVVCHGGVGPLPHFGCGVNDPLLDERLRELTAWLEAHPNEVVLLYLENNLDNDERAHDIAAKMIDATLGGLVYRPAKRCSSIPMDVTRRQIREAGKHVLITGNCGPGGWGFFVHERGPRWKEGGLDYGDDYSEYPCAQERSQERYDQNFIRHWGDETGLSNAADAGGDVTINDARNMIRCGVDMPGLDNLIPFDKRLQRFVWSWANKEPAAGPGCAYQGKDGFFHVGTCNQPRPFACIGTLGSWFVTRQDGAWGQGQQVCSRRAGTYEVPRSGWQNELLRTAKRTDEVWVNYANTGAGWTPKPI